MRSYQEQRFESSIPRLELARVDCVTRPGNRATRAAKSVWLRDRKPLMLSRSMSKFGPMQVVGRPNIGSVPFVQLLAAKVVEFEGRVALLLVVELEIVDEFEEVEL